MSFELTIVLHEFKGGNSGFITLMTQWGKYWYYTIGAESMFGNTVIGGGALGLTSTAGKMASRSFAEGAEYDKFGLQQDRSWVLGTSSQRCTAESLSRMAAASHEVGME